MAAPANSRKRFFLGETNEPCPSRRKTQ